jgi:hypothetical protein
MEGDGATHGLAILGFAVNVVRGDCHDFPELRNVGDAANLSGLRLFLNLTPHNNVESAFPGLRVEQPVRGELVYITTLERPELLQATG